MNTKKVGIVLAFVIPSALAGAGVARLSGRTDEKTAVAAVTPATQAPAAAPAPVPPAPQQPRQVEDPTAVYRVPLDDTPSRGRADALVTIVEFSDVECPFCKRSAGVLKQVEQAYGDKVRFAWKHLPLGMHPNAVPAALVAEAARVRGGDGAFFEVIDELLALEKLDAAAVDAAAREAGLDPARVRLEQKALGRIQRDLALASSLGIRGTPTFVVNGRKLLGAKPFEAFKALVDEELAKAEALLKAGVAPRDVYARVTAKGATAPVMIAAPPIAAAQPPRTDLKVALRGDDPARGPAGAPVTVVEFSDFQCPFCSRALPAVAEVEKAFGEEVRVVWKHMPLSFHPNAMPAALAAEAARAQGKFWEMHDKLFANQQALSDATYGQYAKELGLDVARFEAVRAAPATRKRVEEDLAAAAAVGVTGTPTFVVDGELVLGAGGLRDAVERHVKGRLAKR